MSNSFVTLVSVCCLVFPVLAQRPKPVDKKVDVRINKNQPTVYVTFERKGERKPLYVEESNQGLWLRLHNNTRWTIIMPSFGVPKPLGDAGLFYEVEAIRGEETIEGPSGLEVRRLEVDRVPIGYRLDHTYSPLRLESGKSILFSIPREHLVRNLAVRISFHYEWEGEHAISRGNEPQHNVYFCSSKLPTDL